MEIFGYEEGKMFVLANTTVEQIKQHAEDNQYYKNLSVELPWNFDEYTCVVDYYYAVIKCIEDYTVEHGPFPGNCDEQPVLRKEVEFLKQNESVTYDEANRYWNADYGDRCRVPSIVEGQYAANIFVALWDLQEMIFQKVLQGNSYYMRLRGVLPDLFARHPKARNVRIFAQKFLHQFDSYLPEKWDKELKSKINKLETALSVAKTKGGYYND